MIDRDKFINISKVASNLLLAIWNRAYFPNGLIQLFPLLLQQFIHARFHFHIDQLLKLFTF